MNLFNLGDRPPVVSNHTLAPYLQQFFLFLLLIGLGYLGNYANIELFFGVSFLFGSIAVLLIISLYGTAWGAIAAIATSAYTYGLWGHPYAIIIFTIEAIFIGWQIRHKFKNLVLLDSIYWLIIGIPLVLLFYHQVMQMPLQSAAAIALKQAVNGIFNALVVSLLLAHTPLYRLAARRHIKRAIALQQTLFNWLIAFVFIPVLLLMILDSRLLLVKLENDIQSILQSTSSQVVTQVQTWKQQRASAIESIARLSDISRSEGVALMQQTFPDWQQLFFVDNTGSAIVTIPAKTVMPRNLPQGFSWQNGSIFQRYPVQTGEIIARFDPSFLNLLLNNGNNSRLDLNIVLFDNRGNAIATNNKALNLDTANEINTFADGSYHWLPVNNKPLMARWKNSYYIRETSFGTNSPWTLQIATSAAPHILALEAAYSRSLLTLLIVTAFALPCALWLSRRLLTPLHRLTQITHNLPDKLTDRGEIEWFETGVLEINALLKNFQYMAAVLQDKFEEIRTANETLEQRVKDRTQALQQSEEQLREKAEQLQATLANLRQAQTQLVQTEKMSSLGQLVAGIAHEINNPVNFVFGNLSHAKDYIQDLFDLIALYQRQYPEPTAAICDEIEAIDLDFLRQDLPKLLNSMTIGAERIRDIILSLRNFSRVDETSCKAVNIHEGLETTLMILHNRIKPKPDYPGIKVIKEYAQLPEVECYPGELNQVFMNLIANAIDALEEAWDQYHARSESFGPVLRIQTKCIDQQWIAIHITDNGLGIAENDRDRLFDPFFTTKPMGKGTGLGLSISHQIVVERHQGRLQCYSQAGEGTEFAIEIPQSQIAIASLCHSA
jgi:two-component system NtrC family sensor kinase